MTGCGCGKLARRWTRSLVGTTLGVGSGTGCSMGGRTLGGHCIGVTCREMSASCWIASVCGRLSFAYGAAGAGLRKA
eukprot:scaffold18508_cov37-Attheya_sp.AAC.4